MKILEVDMIKYSTMGYKSISCNVFNRHYNICYTKSVSKLVDFLIICSYIEGSDKYIEKCLSDEDIVIY